MDCCWVPNDTIMKWMRISSHMEWLLNLLQICKMLLKTLYAVDGDMVPPSCYYHQTCGTWFWKAAEISHGSLLGAKWYHHAVVEGLIPHEMVPTLVIQTYRKWLKTSYVVDGNMEPPSCCYHCTCVTQFGKSAEFINHCWVWVQNDTIMQWLRLSFYMEWFLNTLQE